MLLIFCIDMRTFKQVKYFRSLFFFRVGGQRARSAPNGSSTESDRKMRVKPYTVTFSHAGKPARRETTRISK